MIERFGGVAFVSPSMREIAVDADRSVVEFGHRLITGQIEVVILLTGVGTREMLSRVERHIDRERFLHALADVKTIVRGPKPLAVLRELQLTPTIIVPEPNTWREVLAEIDARLPVVNLTVAVQEYGVPNVSLVAGLEARGAMVESFKVYRWDLPEDAGPLRENIKRLAAGDLDVAMFTSAQQVVHLLRVAKEMDLETQIRDAFRRTVDRLDRPHDQRDAPRERPAGRLRTVAPQARPSRRRVGCECEGNVRTQGNSLRRVEREGGSDEVA